MASIFTKGTQFKYCMSKKSFQFCIVRIRTLTRLLSELLIDREKKRVIERNSMRESVRERGKGYRVMEREIAC